MPKALPLGPAPILILSVLGCEARVFEHARGTADGALPEACAGESDGTVCEDHDVCTPISRCMAGACVAGNSLGDCTLADAETGFSTTQGKNGWNYGYWNAASDPDGAYDFDRDFTPLEACPNQEWRPAGQCPITRDNPQHCWTRILNWSLQHPESKNGIEVPIRRWRSDVAGRATVTLGHRLSGTAATARARS